MMVGVTAYWVSSKKIGFLKDKLNYFDFLMKHICYITGCFSRTDALIFERQGVSMVSFGYKVTYLVSDNENDEINLGVHIISSGFKPKNRIQRILLSKVHLYTKSLEIDADLYQISEPELISVGIKLLKKGKKVIFNLRENYPQNMLTKEYLPIIIRKFVSNTLNFYMSKYLKKYNAIISVTPDLVDIVSNSWSCSNSFLVTNYPNINPSYKLSLSNYLNRPDQICYVGTIYRISRQEVFFLSLSKFPNVRYHLAGVFWGKYQKELINLPYWAKVNFQNGFKKSDLKFIYERATISNVLRDFEHTGCPNGSLGVIKVYESMEAALPIICSDVELYREMIEKFNCGICVDPNDHIAIENAIRFLTENKVEAYQMGQNGRQAVLQEYNWNLQATKYESILNHVINT